MLQHVQAYNNRKTTVCKRQMLRVALDKIELCTQSAFSRMSTGSLQRLGGRIEAYNMCSPTSQFFTDQTAAASYLQHLLLAQRILSQHFHHTGLHIIATLIGNSVEETSSIPPVIRGKYFFLGAPRLAL